MFHLFYVLLYSTSIIYNNKLDAITYTQTLPIYRGAIINRYYSSRRHTFEADMPLTHFIQDTILVVPDILENNFINM